MKTGTKQLIKIDLVQPGVFIELKGNGSIIPFFLTSSR